MVLFVYVMRSICLKRVFSGPGKGGTRILGRKFGDEWAGRKVGIKGTLIKID